MKGNEIADALAIEGSSTQFHGPEPPLIYDEKDISSLFNREHKKRWASMDSYWISKNTMPFSDEKRAKFFLNRRRNCLWFLLDILTDHSMLN